ncbi:hypothetical protein CBR_g30929 [Chara braunii]|uniref:Thioredoxin domain-containing protein n=1 Tax=Chara braunii TaxID=69332 RepID=A0A388LDT1_CHABU|nr:hypothetical protein CBR_g30929 [Chara braunii]|eukprot:GBG80466.1 hypothetical protein CBR_g30929 [Chara braunii]
MSECRVVPASRPLRYHVPRTAGWCVACALLAYSPWLRPLTSKCRKRMLLGSDNRKKRKNKATRRKQHIVKPLQEATELVEAEHMALGESLTIEDSHCLTVAWFTATWCGPCRQITPVVTKLNNDYPLVKFLKIDVDENQDLALSEGIQSVPTFRFIKAGRQVSEIKGANALSLEATVKMWA